MQTSIQDQISSDFQVPASSKTNIILTVTAQSNQLLHSLAIKKDKKKKKKIWWQPLRIGTSQISIETVQKMNSWIVNAVCVKQADRMTNSIDPDQTAPQGAV